MIYRWSRQSHLTGSVSIPDHRQKSECRYEFAQAKRRPCLGCDGSEYQRRPNIR